MSENRRGIFLTHTVHWLCKTDDFYKLVNNKRYLVLYMV